MQFGNPVVGGSGALIRNAMKSPDFQAGISGWSVNRNGSAEFNNVTVRGAVTSSTVSGSTILAYNGAPALGNLIASIAETAGTDAYGNAYIAGISAYSASGGATPSTFSALTGGLLKLGSGLDTNNAAALWLPGLNAVEMSSPPYPAAFLTDSAKVTAYSGANSAKPTGSGQNPQVQLSDSSFISPVDLLISGSVIQTGLTGTPEVWQTPTYNANWLPSTAFTGVTPVKALRFRKDAQNNTVINGCFTAAAGAAATVFQLPAGYYDNTAQSGFPIMEKQAAGAFQVGFGYVSTAGLLHVDIGANFTRNAGDLYYVNATIPIGNLP